MLSLFYYFQKFQIVRRKKYRIDCEYYKHTQENAYFFNLKQRYYQEIQ